MNDFAHPDDELDALLGGGTFDDGLCDGGSVQNRAGDASCALRESLRGRSTAAFVRRRRRRRAARGAGMAACYLLGVVTIYGWQQVSATMVDRPAVTATTVDGTNDPPRPIDRPAPTIAERPQTAPSDFTSESGSGIDAAAPVRPKAVKKSRFDALRELGDRHLLADRNPERALRCYRMALRYATQDERLAAARDGTWLLRVVCLDPPQEQEHASKS